MAQPTVLPGTKLLVLIGDGASPETFAEPCGLTTKSFSRSASVVDNTVILDPSSESKSWDSKLVDLLSAQVSGDGVMAVESFNVWNGWFESAASRNVQIKLDDASLGHWEGQFLLTKCEYGGTRGQKVTLGISLVSSGACLWQA